MSPAAAKRACVYGCDQDARTCPRHGRKAQQRTYDDRRGSAASRGYDAKWRRYTVAYRDKLHRLQVPRAGLCGARLPGAPATTDSLCAREGRIQIGTVVDHIVPVTGPDDPRFYDETNHQLLCGGPGSAGCHDRKRQRERGKSRASESVTRG